MERRLFRPFAVFGTLPGTSQTPVRPELVEELSSCGGIVAAGERVRPMSLCHIAVSVDAAGYAVRWTARRSGAIGWPASGGDTIGAASFEVCVTRGDSALVRSASGAPLVIPEAGIAVLGAGPIGFEVVELGALPSRPALLTSNP